MPDVKHTPGPWTFWHGRIATDIDSDGAVIIAERPSNSGGKRQAQVDADMQMMAAALDLLVVAREFLEAMAELGILCECGEEDCRTTRARAAIARATGEQP